jgi:hypothetical protein
LCQEWRQKQGVFPENHDGMPHSALIPKLFLFEEKHRALVHHGTFGRMRGSFSEVLNDEADCP